MGAVFTPVPWRLITDAALWSENWPGIPVPVRGEIRTRFTNCALCPAGCAVRARSVGDQPVSLAGVTADPLSRGALCPFGFTGHHLPYDPARVRTGPAAEAAAAVARAAGARRAGERVAVLDLRPGRTASWTLRRAMAAVEGGTYLAPPQPAFAADPSAAGMVLGLGAPLLDGWGHPGHVLAARDGFRLVQADATESRTAIMADEWLRIRPGTEDALARGLAGALQPGQGISPAEAASITGVPQDRIGGLARELAANRPLVIGPPASAAVDGLNLLLGAWGRTLFPRREAPVPDAWKKAAPVSDLASLPDRSIRVLLIDESAPGDYIPWPEIEKKLATDDPVVVAFTASMKGYGRYARFALPVAVYPEAVDDTPAPVDSAAAAFRISTPLVAPPGGMSDAVAFVAQLAGISAGNPLEERAAAIHKAGRGKLIAYAGGEPVAVKDIKPEDFWKGLNEGGCWMDDTAMPAPAPEPRGVSAAARPVEASDLPLTVALSGRFAGPASPLLSKLYQESNLRLGPRSAALAPETAAAAGLAAGGRATLHTALGACEIEILTDPGVPPGVIEVAARPEVLDLCASGARAKVVRA